jgi:hypothetical protein
MCGIAASYNPEALIALFKLNKTRGNGRWSLNKIDIRTNRIIDTVVSETELTDGSELHPGRKEDVYYVLHVQAPTGQGNAFHPARENGTSVWHNGIIKEAGIKYMQTKLGSNCTWDTNLMAQMFDKYSIYDWLSDIDGSFACIKLQEDLTIFRNQVCPLFIDADLNISSTKFPGSKSLEANKVFSLNLPSMTIKCTDDTFKTFDMPYYIPGDK